MGPRARTPTGATAAPAERALLAATVTPTSTTASPVRAGAALGTAEPLASLLVLGLGSFPRAWRVPTAAPVWGMLRALLGLVCHVKHGLVELHQSKARWELAGRRLGAGRVMCRQ